MKFCPFLNLLASATSVVAVFICSSWPMTAKAQDASTYYTVQHAEQFQTDWRGFYRDVDAKTAAVRAEFPHHLDLPFGQNVKQRLDLYLPKGKVAAAPVFLFLHGGGFREGDRAQYGFVARPFMDKGIIVAVASYRLTGSGFAYPSQLDDAKLAVIWLHKHIKRYGGDGMRIYVSGHSSGAVLAAEVGVDRSWLRQSGVPVSALQGIAPISALYDLRITDPAVFKEAFWNVYTPTLQLQTVASPLLNIRDSVPAALVAVGSVEAYPSQDFVAGSKDLVAKLNAAGSHAEFLSLEGKDHRETVLALGEPGSELSTAVIRMITGGATKE